MFCIFVIQKNEIIITQNTTIMKLLANTLKAIKRGELTLVEIISLHAPVIVLKGSLYICGKIKDIKA